MERLLTTLSVAIAAACGGGNAAAPKPKVVLGPEVDEKTAERDARGLVAEVYDTVNRGKSDNLFSLLDDGLIVFGPRGDDALASRADTLVALGSAVEAQGKKLALRGGELRVVTSPGGRSAWAVDVVSAAGESHPVTAILTNSNELWQVSAVLVGRAVARRELNEGSSKDAVVPAGARAKGQVAEDARGAIERFQRGLLDQQLWGDDLAKRSDAVVVSPSGEVTAGKKAIKKLWSKRVDAKTRAAVVGELSSGATPDGALVWVTAALAVGTADGPAPPVRAFAVYEKAEDGWSLVALHEAAAPAGAGDGTAYRKAAPAAAPEQPVVAEPEKPKKKDKGDKGDKKQKKKKKKKAKEEAS